MNKLKNIFFLSLLLGILLCCTNEENDSAETPENLGTTIQSALEDQVETFKDSVYHYGSVNSYNSLSELYLVNYPSEDLFFWSFIMANKYSHSEAYIDCYYSIHSPMWERYNIDSFFIDKEIDSLLTGFLLSADDLNNERAFSLLSKHNENHNSDSNIGDEFWNNEGYTETLNDGQESLKDTKDKIFYFGDTAAYKDLRRTYEENNKIENLVFWSLIMAHNFNHSAAYLDVFYSVYHPLKRIENSEQPRIDKKTELFLYKYLNLALVNGAEGVDSTSKDFERNLIKNPR